MQEQCYTLQRAMPQNQGVADEVLHSYCACVAGGVAKNMTDDEVELAATNYPAVRDRIRALSASTARACLADLTKPKP